MKFILLNLVLAISLFIPCDLKFLIELYNLLSLVKTQPPSAVVIFLIEWNENVVISECLQDPIL